MVVGACLFPVALAALVASVRGSALVVRVVLVLAAAADEKVLCHPPPFVAVVLLSAVGAEILQREFALAKISPLFFFT